MPEVLAIDTPSPAPSRHAATPPPSLVTDGGTAARSYARDLLLALATPTAQPPAPERLNSFSELIRKDSSSDWGVDEEQSTILDGEPISKSLPIPKQTKLNVVEGEGHPADLLFNYRSSPGDSVGPILIDFTNPDPFSRPPTARKTPASTFFQVFPGSASSSTTTLTGEGMALSMGEKFSALRLEGRSPSLSRSASPVSSHGRLSRSSSVSGVPGLNPFAAPWPLPDSTPKLAVTPPNSTPLSIAPSPARSNSSSDSLPSLPLPKTLPSSLPPRPNAVLPPVFVKRESAALPIPMAHPDIPPLGREWEGENSLSGNERRRRASEMTIPLPVGDKLGVMRMGRSVGADGGGRPERLVMLGKKLRESVSKQSPNHEIKT